MPQDQSLELQRRLNKAIGFITHDLDEALRLGIQIAILRDGEILQQGTPEDMCVFPQMITCVAPWTAGLNAWSKVGAKPLNE